MHSNQLTQNLRPAKLSRDSAVQEAMRAIEVELLEVSLHYHILEELLKQLVASGQGLAQRVWTGI